MKKRNWEKELKKLGIIQMENKTRIVECEKEVKVCQTDIAILQDEVSEQVGK